jgi:hypothetical protein
MNVRYLRNGSAAFRETNDCRRRPAARKASGDFSQKERHLFDAALLQVRGLATFRVSATVRAASAKLVVFALDLPIIGLQSWISSYDRMLLARPSTEGL